MAKTTESTDGLKFAIKLPNGLYCAATPSYSHGYVPRGVEMNKAKLWSNIGHLRNHLSSTSLRYPEGAMIVGIRITYEEKTMATVASYVEDARTRRARRNHEIEVAAAQRELDDAQRRLTAAKRRVASL